MSVLFKSPSSSGGSIGRGSSKGFPPGDAINIQHTTNSNKILIKWTDPEDTIIDGITLSKWKGTLLIRNSDHYPNNIKDGDIVIDNTERNKCKDVWYEDNNLTNNTTYYYRFFTYSDEKIYNDSGNLVFKDKPLSFAPILKDNTWEQIAAASESDSIPSTWKVGDEIDLDLSPMFGILTLQIWDFNHFDKSDGSGKAGICFGMKHLMKDKQKMNSSGTNSGGWNDSYMRNTVMNNIYKSIPAELKDHIKEVKTEANSGGSNNASKTCSDKLFIPGYKEIGFVYENFDGNQTKFPIFSDNNSRIKKYNNGTEPDGAWWTRSPTNSFDFLFRFVDYLGSDAYDGKEAYADLGVCFCFNI